MSLQAYMRDQLVTLAARPTKQEAIERVERVLADFSGEPSREAIIEDLHAERR